MSRHQPVWKHSVYLQDLIRTEELSHIVTKALEAIESRNLEFDAIAFRGMSGALIAPTLAIMLSKSLIMVRKPNDGSHSGCRVEGDAGAKNYIIVDDFVESGKTVCAILDEVCEFSGANCVGVLQVSNLGRLSFLNDEAWLSDDLLNYFKERTLLTNVPSMR